MVNESDAYVLEQSLSKQDNSNVFENKKWTYVTDSTSSNGAFSGQIQFDLSNLSNANQFTNLAESVITFPVKLSIKNTTGAAPAACTVNAATIKHGFHQFVDSVQIVLGGQTIQSSQIYTNIDTNYKILTEWSEEQYNKLAPTLGLGGLDDISPPNDAVMAATSSLDNYGVVTTGEGLNLNANLQNQGIKKRFQMFNNTSAASLGKSILGTDQHVLGKSNVQVNAADATLGNDVFVLHALGTIRLCDISDAISKLPLMKNLTGFIYLNYNSSVTTITNDTGALTVDSYTSQASYGRCCPAAVNYSATGLHCKATGVAPVTFTADISAVASSTLTTAAVIQNNAILHAPYYSATPEINRVLSMKKTIRYNERFVTEFNIAANGSVNQTLTPGISNPTRVILYPYFTGAGSSGNTFSSNPLLSPFDGCPSTTSPFASLKNFQLNVGNQPMFQSPINFDYQTFLNEVSPLGLDGGQDNKMTSGLLNQRSWNQLYRYYTVDVSRRLNSEDGASKSIQISCTNATTCPMRVIAIIHYQKEITVDTASGQITQGM